MHVNDKKGHSAGRSTPDGPLAPKTSAMSPDPSRTKKEELQQAVTELSVLNDIATTITSVQPLEDIVEQIVKKCIDHLGVREAMIGLLDREGDEDEFHTMIRRQASSTRKVPSQLDDRLTGWMVRNREILLSNDIREDDRFRFLNEEAYTFRSLLGVPLIVKGTLIGYLAAFDKKDGSSFHEEDRRLLSIIGSQSAQVIENARLYEEEKELIALQREMDMARQIQVNLLPDEEPEADGYRFSATNIPAKSVGGDYYDFLEFDSGRVGFCLGDITGKGMPAAMLMSNLQATFRSQAWSDPGSTSCMAEINRMLYRSTEPNKFSTFFYGVLDTASGEISYANGGHEAPLLFRSEDDEPERLDPTGLLLGVMEETGYESGSVRLRPGDLLVLYSDGVTEAMNAGEEAFGREGLVEVVKKHRGAPAERITEAVLEAISNYAGEAGQSDDITLMLIEKR